MRRCPRCDERFVVFDPGSVCDGRRLGNQIFSISAMLYVARRTNRTPVLPDPKLWRCIQDFEAYFIPEAGLFEHRLGSNGTKLLEESCPCFGFHERLAMAFDESVESLWNNAETASHRTIALSGYFQSWKYVEPVADLMRRALVFNPAVRQSAERFLQESVPTTTTATTTSACDGRTVVVRLVRIGVHVRRGDMSWSRTLLDRGYAPPGPEFYRLAISYFIEQYSRLQFIVLSDDVEWARQNVVVPANDTMLQSDGMYCNCTCCLHVNAVS
jgi:hypothetical protein